MSMSASKRALEDPREALRKITRMIRTGLATEGDAGVLHGKLFTAISGLKQAAKSQSIDFGETEQTRLATLEAEFYSQSGNHQQAASTLFEIWQKLEPRLIARATSRTRFDASGDRPLLRQQIWAMLHYVFYRYYTVDAQYEEAKAYLEKISIVIREELQTPEGTPKSQRYTPHGTLAIYHYFLGQCERALRSFPEAQANFLQAQKEAQNRLDLKLSTPSPEVDVPYEIAYNNVFTARVLGVGVGWVALHQGRLVRAEQLLRASQALLTSTSQESLKLFIRTILSMAVRRKAPFESREYRQSLDDLKDCYKTFGRINDLSGQLRTGLEIVRAFNDFAEFGHANGASSPREIEQAQVWIEKLIPFMKRCGPKDQVRLHLHTARLLMAQGYIARGRNEVDEAKKIEPAVASSRRAILIVEATVSLKENDTAAAERAIGEALGITHYQGPGGPESLDPVLEAECIILLAKVCLLRRNRDGADRYVRDWQKISRFVDNQYLHRMAETIRPQYRGLAFSVPYNFALKQKTRHQESTTKTLVAHAADFERFLVDSVLSRKGLDPSALDFKFSQDLEEIFGRDRFWWNRYRKSLRGGSLPLSLLSHQRSTRLPKKAKKSQLSRTHPRPGRRK